MLSRTISRHYIDVLRSPRSISRLCLEVFLCLSLLCHISISRRPPERTVLRISHLLKHFNVLPGFFSFLFVTLCGPAVSSTGAMNSWYKLSRAVRGNKMVPAHYQLLDSGTNGQATGRRWLGRRVGWWRQTYVLIWSDYSALRIHGTRRKDLRFAWSYAISCWTTVKSCPTEYADIFWSHMYKRNHQFRLRSVS